MQPHQTIPSMVPEGNTIGTEINGASILLYIIFSHCQTADTVGHIEKEQSSLN